MILLRVFLFAYMPQAAHFTAAHWHFAIISVLWHLAQFSFTIPDSHYEKQQQQQKCTTPAHKITDVNPSNSKERLFSSEFCWNNFRLGLWHAWPSKREKQKVHPECLIVGISRIFYVRKFSEKAFKKYSGGQERWFETNYREKLFHERIFSERKPQNWSFLYPLAHQCRRHWSKRIFVCQCIAGQIRSASRILQQQQQQQHNPCRHICLFKVATVKFVGQHHFFSSCGCYVRFFLVRLNMYRKHYETRL